MTPELPRVWALDPEGHKCNAWWGLDGSLSPAVFRSGWVGDCGRPAMSVIETDDGQGFLAVCSDHQDAMAGLMESAMRWDSQGRPTPRLSADGKMFLEVRPSAIEELFVAAEQALECNEILRVGVDRLVVVPDTVMLEGEANEHEPVPTWTLKRGDGRTVGVYRLPDSCPDLDDES